ncbi:MAG: bifunctional 2-C-methyl-D-erythritol 4-phosphate cytidylyltransferase/2-C-methyl-D-erythritol 2,4-cyclodiphosphate synthase [Geminicoccaceae bacterium]|nr:bifunctional 2-C-methyl-D-erythritol 4-phosphate cytidylyltransferase/2-C-methyl-D-erythritol 2,4-cyclodiphosphate synthase [Geminicoccaceae bacterium]
MQNAVLIVAGGNSTRFGGDRPKQYARLGDRTVLRRAIDTFMAVPRIDHVQLVIGDGHLDDYRCATRGLDLPAPVMGGDDRQASTLHGLERLALDGPPVNVLVHDGARPLVSTALVERVLDGLARHEAILPVAAVPDTLKKVTGDRVTGEIPRDDVRRSQTPQGFRFDLLLAAHRKFAGTGRTDDAAIVGMSGGEVVTVEGEEDNIKITRNDDLARAARLCGLPAVRWRTGLGIDVHAFETGRPLVLGGLVIPHDRGLAGHSDADVALHAITDALFGAIADGDIGSHFPPGDPKWRDADSVIFLEHAASRVRARGGFIEHVDLVILCERPKIGPHRSAMRERIASILAIGIDQVSVKASTTERLGFTGREEGIMAHATVTVGMEQQT